MPTTRRVTALTVALTSTVVPCRHPARTGPGRARLRGQTHQRGRGTLFLTGNDTWHGTSAVLGGRLSVVGSHASSIDVRGGTLGGRGSVAGGADIAEGVLQPGVDPREAKRAANALVVPGDVLSVGRDVRLGAEGQLAVTISGDNAYTSVRAAGDLELDGDLDLDVHGTPTPGTVLTIMSGGSVSGTFRGLAEGGVVKANGHQFRVSYQGNGVTPTVLDCHPGREIATDALTERRTPG